MKMQRDDPSDLGLRHLGVRLALLVCLLCQAQLVRGQSPEQVLYIRGEFNDAPFMVGPSTWLQRLEAIDAVAEDYWIFNSYGEISEFQSSYTTPYNIGSTSGFQTTNSSGQIVANVQAIRAAMRGFAAADGWDLSQFDQVVLSFPSIVGFPAGALGSPGNVWMPGSNPDPDGYTHEFGHALGVGHASTFEGGVATYPGEHREGRDGLFMLGSDGGVLPVAGRPRRAPINLPMRHMLGFVDSALIQEVTANETVRIHAFDRESIDGDVAAGRTLSATVAFDNREWWISYAPSLADRWASFNGEGWADGVIVQQAIGGITRSLDFTPGSQGGSGNQEDFVDTRDGALRVGERFTFPDSTLTLAPQQTGITDGVPWIDVSISFSFDPLTADFNNDSNLNLDDYAVLLRNLNADVSGLSLAESFALGDITGDKQLNIDDLRLFRQTWDGLFGEGAFSTALAAGIPEPSSLGLVCVFGFVAASRCLRRI